MENLKSPFKQMENIEPNLPSLIIKAEEDLKEKAREDKTYVILYYIYLDGNEEQHFDIITGREKAYNYIKGMIDDIDLHRSKILTDNVSFKDAISTYDFMVFAKESLGDELFHLDSYAIDEDEVE